MTLDGFTLHFIVDEMAKSLTGYKVDKVHQPQPDTVLLALRGSGAEAPKNIRLLLSAGAADSRIHITDRKYENPKSPPMFCMFLRKYLTGAKILDIRQVDLERIVDFVFETKDELGLPYELTLVTELMGKYSNIILKNENNIIMDCLRHVTQAQSRVRSVLPSLEYKLPSSSKINPITASTADIAEALIKNNGSLKSYLSTALQGVSGQTAEEIIFRYAPAGITGPIDTEKFSEIIKSFYTAQNAEPSIYFNSDKEPVFYSPFRYWSYNAEDVVRTAGVNELVDMFYGILYDTRVFNGKRDSLSRQVAKHLEKQTSLLKKQLEAVENSKKADSYKNTGDIITANIYRIKKGMESFVAEDFLTGQQTVIKLDLRLSPSSNAQANYKKYSKLKAGMDITLKRMLETKNEIAFLESVQVSLESSESINELREIEYELSKAGSLSHAAAAGSKTTDKPSEPHKFLSSGGYTFYAGKNNRQNDLLTMKTASPDDIWLHTKDIPGCHVIITGVKDELPERTLFEAATVAATLSKAKGSSKVSVDYTRRKNVRKPNGAKPGMVVYEHYNTVIVNPDESLMKKLLIKV